MPDNFLTQLLPNTEIEEQQFLSYVFDNLSEVYTVPDDYFYNFDCKAIMKALKKITESNDQFSVDELTYICKQNDPDFNVEIIDIIKNRTVTDILKIKERIKENNLKYNTIKQLEKVIVKATAKGNISFDDLGESINDLYYSIHNLKTGDLKDTEQLIDNYFQVLERRKVGDLIRTLGFNEVDSMLTKPASDGQMTAIVAGTGGAKTTFAKNVELKSISKQVPVLSINLENEEEDCTDLLSSIMTNLPLEELMKKEMNPRREAIIKRTLENFRGVKNYLSFTEPELSLGQLDGLLYKAKHIFRERGVLKEDENYMLVIIDLTEMLDEYSIAKSQYEIKTVMNKLHQMNRKHKCHMLLLIQANENKIRTGKIFKNSDDLDFYKIGLEDIEGSASISKRCRVVITLTRPVQMKKRFFPEEMERWDFETDVINLSVIKQNQGKEGFKKFVLTNTFRIYAFEDLVPEEVEKE